MSLSRYSAEHISGAANKVNSSDSELQVTARGSVGSSEPMG